LTSAKAAKQLCRCSTQLIRNERLIRSFDDAIWRFHPQAKTIFP
jgi:hypothetical protein